VWCRVQPDQLDHGGGVARARRDLGRHGDVLEHREARDQVVELEDEPDVPPAEERQLRGAHLGQLGIAKVDRTLRGPVHAAEQVQQRALARSARTENDEHLALEDLRTHSTQGVHLDLAHAVDLAGVAHGEERSSRRVVGHPNPASLLPRPTDVRTRFSATL
jgi:hypothetical protein